jgi:DNA polymerase III subunit epsilon
MEPRTLKAAYKFYCNKSLDDAHEALPDAIATKEVLEAMLDKYNGVEYTDGKGQVSVPIVNDMEKIHALSERRKKADLVGQLVYNDNDEVVFNFGKYKGVTVEEVFQRDPGYYSWMMNADFPLYTKRALSQIREQLKG